ncbi:hypothetical protein Lal_00040508 [Lupinus albus]|uniref:Putative transcription regulator GNAT family n=1 Tax=Lupinus albus TaxID=3870 RepID=A0A6A4PK37_LUPAL|nr:putative transcription regulator GNAT family [Lupinus albus]KAF1887454.1 hypothetical protein Lal_00040508 [Lupinus albus]
MTLVSSSVFPIPLHIPQISALSSSPFNCSFSNLRTQIQSSSSVSIETQQHHSPKIDTSFLTIDESFYDDEFWAAASLRVRSFNVFRPDTFGLRDHIRFLTEREFGALKERVSGKRVSCINASILLHHISNLSDDLFSSCKFSSNGEERIIVGSLDLNQCLSLADEIAGTKPEATGADITRAYLSNVCVANELQRNGLGYALLEKSKLVAHDRGITDLYVHVAVDNEPAKKLYTKSGFVYESEEPAWQARFLDRPRRLLLWKGLSST